MTSTPVPFPWQALPRRARDEAEALRQVRAALAPEIALDRLAEEASRLLRREVTLQLRGASMEALRPGARVISLELKGTEVRFWVEAEAGLPYRVTEAVLGAGSGPLDPARGASPEVEGAWAAVLVALLRRCSEAAPGLGAPPIPGKMAVVSAAVRLDGEVFGVRVGVLAGQAPEVRLFDRGELAALGAMRLTLPLVGAFSLGTRDELASLEAGTAWLPGEGWGIERAGASWGGRGWLVTPRGELGAEVLLEERQGALALVLGRDCAPRSWEVEMSSAEPDPLAPEAGLADVLAETPVVVRVEVASITLEAQQWARLGVGEVVATGVRLGEPVVLRAGGAVFARGELCVLDGELAVKILQRL
jgi:flagellar motor switch/type III secretory pathway protein FliN